MIGTFYAEGALDSPAGLFAAAAIGLLFGFWLERAGFGSSRRLAAIFYLRDFAVLKVMFTAMAVAMVGLAVLDGAGVIDAAAIYRPETFLGPQVVGGLVFGAGFVIGGFCPGTALVGLASGKLDALVFLAGAGLGSLAFAGALAVPGAAPLASAGACGVSSWPEALGLSGGAAMALVVAVAVAAFAVAERVEARSAKPTAADLEERP